MSWFRAIADSLRLDDDEEDEETKTTASESAPRSTSTGVKSELTKTLTTKLWGFDPPEEAAIAGIRSDLAEIGGRFKLGISKIASTFLQIGSEERYESSVGVTEEVLSFVSFIAMDRETWLDFPVPDGGGDGDEFGEFDMSDAQQEHALAVEHLVPRLAALRMELCPEYMSDGCFWKIYFVLLHPRLDKQIALLLSTPQIMEARALLTPDLQNRTNTGLQDSTIDISAKEEATPATAVTDSEIDKHTVQSTEIQVIDKSIIEEKPATQMKPDPSSSKDETDEWLKEDVSEIAIPNRTTAPVLNDEEDVSFSDLEDDEDDAPSSYKKDGSDSSAKDSQDWVQLGRSSTDSAKDINSTADTKRSDQVSSHNDWLDVNDIDMI